ncbi:MAG: BamA/TamA family outer membrane protein [Pyrinomonadaceae bacterium MAG19_C2-C3]|nr:BamA/TamA family outer membrane protein [Pyrinomonadaceae bacterium MAG19_C2-C3]
MIVAVFLLVVFGGDAARGGVPRKVIVPQDLSRYEGRTISTVEVALDGVARVAGIEANLLALVRLTANETYKTVEVRDSLVALFESGTVANGRVEVTEEGANVRVRFLVKLQPRVSEVVIDLQTPPDVELTEDELRGRLNMLEPGARATESVLRENADLIQAFLRDRGFYQATVDFTQQPNQSGIRSVVTYRVRSGEQVRINNFTANINGFSVATVEDLRLRRGEPFSQALLGEELTKIRDAIIELGYLAPQLGEARTTYDLASNTIDINLSGSIGPKVDVRLVGYDEFDDDKTRELLPVRRTGSIDISAIVEGERRLRNELQENGYFFAEVSSSCNINPPLTDALATDPNIGQACELINAEELTGRNVTITYNIDTNRRYKLTDLRIEGTNKLITETEDIRDSLRTKEANALGFIPLIGYGRGYTSLALLEQDRQFIRQRMAELGYRRATVDVRQGISLEDESLIITFDVTEGPLTRVAGTEVRGNKIFNDEQVNSELRNAVTGAPYSRALAQQDGERLLALYARNGYTDTDVSFDTIDLPRADDAPVTEDERVRVVYTITEGEKVFINRIFVNGNERTTRNAITRTLRLQEGDILRADRIAESERALYATDAFRTVTIRTEPATDNASGFRRRNVIINVEERAPRVLDYGGGFSTDTGALGIFEIRNTNLLGRLRQGALRVRASQRRQLLQLEYFDPRFDQYGKDKQFMPLIVSAQYSRDTTVTRFFRSTVDRGANGIVQRLDPEGNPIDLLLGTPAGNPTINRATFNVETRRDFEPLRDENNNVTRQQSTLFLRYTYEDVRLLNIESLLIRDILRPDRTVRLSRFSGTFARDTRDSQTDATRGSFLSLDNTIALRQLGGNISFNKFQSTYRRYQQVIPNSENRFGRTVLSGSINVGLANIFNARDRAGISGVIDDADLRLPISERFFTGGSTTLRGFAFEEAGPRVAIPGGIFLNRDAEEVEVSPFTVPVGGNALFVVNAEARIPITRRFSLVPFYDGGNIYDRVGDIFRKTPRPDDTRPANFRVDFTHTVGLGIRFRTPFGPLALDYGFLLNPPEFTLPQREGLPVEIIRLRNSRLQIRFGQAF